MTRRKAVLIGLALPAWAYSAKDFWNQKDPKDWTEEERLELLTNSPWARKASVHYNDALGSLGGVPVRTGRMSRRAPVGGGTGAPGTINEPGNYEAIVRWDSALPIREANRNASKDDPAANYIISLSGDLPMLGRPPAEASDEENQRRLEMFKQYTKLEKRGDPIFLIRIGYEGGTAKNSETSFYFERNDLIRPNDRQVTFVTKLGPLDVKCKFILKEMLYRGKLEL